MTEARVCEQLAQSGTAEIRTRNLLSRMSNHDTTRPHGERFFWYQPVRPVHMQTTETGALT